MSKNKVKYGLKNCYYAKATIDELTNTATYAKPKPWKGAVSLSQEQQGEVTKFRADNVDYWVGASNNGYQGDFESARIPDDFRKDILGDIEDSNGVLIENAEAKTQPFAFLFQFEGDASNTRYVLYNCTATRPTISGSTTEETIEPQTETVTVTAVAIHNAGLDLDVVRGYCEEDNPQYATFFDEVYQSTALATYATVTFDTDGGSIVDSQSVRVGTTCEEPAAPTKAGYVFDKWYADSAFATEFDFSAAITADTTVTLSLLSSLQSHSILMAELQFQISRLLMVVRQQSQQILPRADIHSLTGTKRQHSLTCLTSMILSLQTQQFMRNLKSNC